MAEPQFSSDDDLPRTFRREREAREREAREREAAQGPAGHGASAQVQPLHAGMTRDFGPAPQDFGPATAPDPQYASPGLAGTVSRIEVPFLHLVVFFLKAVIAAIPALILLTLLLFAGGQMLKAFFPNLRHFEIVVRSPEPVAAASAPKSLEPAKATPAPSQKK